MIKWGIAGAGIVASKFAQAVNSIEGSVIYGVASKTNADKFAEKHDIPIRYKDYQNLADDPDIDAVYISTIHPLHYHLVMMMLNKKKAVLCEKPAGIHAEETEDMVKLAHKNHVFFMEAMWTKFLPAILYVKEVIPVIGSIKRVKAEFCINVKGNIHHRLFDKALGGGALLDMGIYPLSFIHMLLGLPDQIIPALYVGEYGVDEMGEVSLLYSGAIAQASFAIRCDGLDHAIIYGEKGKIEIPNFHKATRIYITSLYSSDTEYITPPLVNGFEYEIQEVARCIERGKIESEIHTHRDCIEIAKIMDYVQGEAKSLS